MFYCIYFACYIWSLTSAWFTHTNSQMPFHNWTQLIIMAATYLFLCTNVTVNHMWHKSTLQVSVQQCWIIFETAAHCRELELNFFNMQLTEEGTWFLCGNSWDLCTLWFCVLNNFESLTVLKTHSYFY